jgi:hypothetical protein
LEGKWGIYFNGDKSYSGKKLIEISRLESILTIIPTMEESLDYILMDEIEKELNSSTEEE